MSTGLYVVRHKERVKTMSRSNRFVTAPSSVFHVKRVSALNASLPSARVYLYSGRSQDTSFPQHFQFSTDSSMCVKDDVALEVSKA